MGKVQVSGPNKECIDAAVRKIRAIVAVPEVGEETHFGIFPLKEFFSEGLENQDGEEVSTREIKKALKDCVENEDKRKPLTDDQLVAEMGKKGYKVARRTIAKYRDQLDIPKARLRKEL